MPPRIPMNAVQHFCGWPEHTTMPTVGHFLYEVHTELYSKMCTGSLHKYNWLDNTHYISSSFLLGHFNLKCLRMIIAWSSDFTGLWDQIQILMKNLMIFYVYFICITLNGPLVMLSSFCCTLAFWQGNITWRQVLWYEVSSQKFWAQDLNL